MFDSGRLEHLHLAAKMGVTVMKLSDGRLQLTHSPAAVSIETAIDTRTHREIYRYTHAQRKREGDTYTYEGRYAYTHIGVDQ